MSGFSAFREAKWQ